MEFETRATGINTAAEDGTDDHKDVQSLTDIFGTTGRWQLTIALQCFVATLLCNWNALGYAFFAYPLDHWCARPPQDILNISAAEWKNVSIPLEVDKTGKSVYSNCNMYQYHVGDNETAMEKLKCDEWEFDRRDLFTDTIQTQWNLVCDKAWLVSTSQSIYMAGFLVAVFLFGQLSDRFGRRPIMLFCIGLLMTSSVFILFSPSFLLYVIARFVIAMGVHGLSTTTFVVLIEVSGSEHRPLMTFIMTMGWGTGFFLMPALAWTTGNWFSLQIAVSTSSILLIAYWWLMPESPRWLITQHRYREAKNLIRSAAKTNGMWRKESEAIIDKYLRKLNKESITAEEKRVTLLDLLRSRNLRRRILNVFFAWFCTSFVYYGLSMNTSTLGGDPFVNFAIAGALEYPAYIIAYYLLRYFGRRRPLTAILATSATTCFITIFIGDSLLWLRIALAMIGKCGVTASFNIIYIYTTELFPTVTRNAALGSSSTCARIGSVIAPFIKELDEATYPFVPMILFGSVTLLSSGLVLLLPETMNQAIPDSLEEGESFGMKVKCDSKTSNHNT